MLLSITILILSVVLLYYGAEWLVKGASRLALSLGVKPLIVGLTIVSFGTSSPELLSSLVAVFGHGSGSIAVGNVIGSNVFNIGWILGLSALLTPLAIHSDLIRREAPINIAVTGLLLFLMWDGVLSQFDGLLLFACFVAYLVLQTYHARKSQATADLYTQELEEEVSAKAKASHLNSVALIIIGIIGLALGAHWLVGEAVAIARVVGISERVIGLTIIAMGTSLPELATSVVAALKKETDIAVGNIIGSNIFNILLVVGAVASLKPLSFDLALIHFDAWFLLGLTVVMMVLIMTQRKLVRWEGAVLLLCAIGYTTQLFLR